VLALRQQYPRWGKDKLVVLLRREQLTVSTSMVGRILTYLKQRGLIDKLLQIEKSDMRFTCNPVLRTTGTLAR
jgi:hypothetical protein